MEKKRPIVVTIVATYCCIEGLFFIYKFFYILQSGKLELAHLSNLLFAVGFLTAGIGLYLKRGWGRNFALFFIFYILFASTRSFLSYFVIENKVIFITKGAISFLIFISVLMSLLNRNVKSKFTNSPSSLVLLGSMLFMYGVFQRTGNMIIDTLWVIIGIVGLSFALRGMNELRKGKLEIKY